MLSRLFRRSDLNTLQPAEDLVVIGDVHGRVDLLTRALESVGDRRCICLGDYVDRGPDSAAVLTLLHNLPDVVCLTGNHEAMMLAFLDAPNETGPRWLRAGGDDTLNSFGIKPPQDGEDPVPARNALAEAMGADMIQWLRALPAFWISGNIAMLHAGADPDMPIEKQAQDTLIWGHRHFGRRRPDGMWIIHGHTVVARPQIRQNRISIDTGAYLTGRLTVATLRSGSVYFDTIQDL